MKPTTRHLNQGGEIAVRRRRTAALAIALGALPINAFASMFSGEALDTVADVMTWVVLVVAPVVAIGVFLLIHILPEKIAERKHHPQLNAIKTLCLLSLVFGGMLWPLAWLWAYTKPVLHKMAYGSDQEVHGAAEDGAALSMTGAENKGAVDEVTQLRHRIAELEAKLTAKPAAAGAKV